MATPETPAHRDERHAQLLAAALALRGWAHQRRRTWSAEPLDRRVDQWLPVQGAVDQPTLAHEQPSVADRVSRPAPAPRRRLVDVAQFLRALRSRASQALVPRAQAFVSRTQALRSPLLAAARSARSLRAPLLRWSWRLGLAVGVVAMAGVAARTLPARWSSLSRAWAPLRAVSVWGPRTGTAVLDSVPPGSQVIVDGILTGATPLTTTLTTGRHVVKFHRQNAERTQEIDITAGHATSVRVDWLAKPMGHLHVETTPPGASVTVDSRARGVTPLTIDDLAIGSHAVALASANGSVRKTVDIAADRTTEISESITSGWLHVSSSIELSIAEGTRGLNLDERNLIMLPPGFHDLRFENRAFGFRDTRQIEVKPGQTTLESVEPPASAVTVVATLPASVSIDGKHVGDTPLTDQPVTVGTHDIIVSAASGAQKRVTMTVTVKPARLAIDFATP